MKLEHMSNPAEFVEGWLLSLKNADPARVRFDIWVQRDVVRIEIVEYPQGSPKKEFLLVHVPKNVIRPKNIADFLARLT